MTMDHACEVRMDLVTKYGEEILLKEKTPLLAGEIIDSMFMMAKKAEEYGSHDNTFEIPVDGIVRIVEIGGEVLIEQQVEKGDIWRMCQTKDEPVRDSRPAPAAPPRS
jgi:monomeric isocitrate dehydrogenase